MKKPRSPWLQLLYDLLITCLILLVFAFFHHGRVFLQGKIQLMLHTPIKSMQDVNTDGNPGNISLYRAGTAVSAEMPESEEEVEEEIPDLRTEWQKKFADHFTDEIVVTDYSYSSPNVSITVTPYEINEGNKLVHYYVADIYIGSIEAFRTYLADNLYELYRTQPIIEMDRDSGALLAMTGDFYSYQYSGLMVRNGVHYRHSYTDSDICVLYRDGTMHTYRNGSYSKDDVLAGDIWQLWNFGPALLDENGDLPSGYNTSNTVSFINPRSSVGYFEPGHYCFIVVDGRLDNWSDGMTLPELSQVYHDLGCIAAYNLDGGGSAVMTFGDEIISRQSNGGDRELGDILLIAEPDTYDPSAFPAPLEDQ